MKKLLPLLIFFLLTVVVFSDCSTTGNNPASADCVQSDYFGSSIVSQGSQFASSLTTVPTTASNTMSSLLSTFNPGNCGPSWVDPDGQESILAAVGAWAEPSILVILICLFGLSIIYMVGNAVSNPGLIAIAKDEFFQTGLTVFRIFFILVVIAGMQSWYSLKAAGVTDTNSIYYPANGNSNIMDASMAFGRLMVSNMITQYGMLIMYNTVIHTIYSATLWIGVTWRSMYSFNLGPVLKPLIDGIGQALQVLSLGITEWLLHLVLLCLIKQWTWTLFIPVSILLRAIPFTRNAGEALFAISCALAVFYPFMFLIDYEVNKVLINNVPDPTSVMNNFLGKSNILSVVGGTLVAMFLMSGVAIPFFMGAIVSTAFSLWYGVIYYAVIICLLLPALNIFVTLTAAKEIAALFRTDVNFMSFLRIL